MHLSPQTLNRHTKIKPRCRQDKSRRSNGSFNDSAEFKNSAFGDGDIDGDNNGRVTIGSYGKQSQSQSRPQSIGYRLGPDICRELTNPRNRAAFAQCYPADVSSLLKMENNEPYCVDPNKQDLLVKYLREFFEKYKYNNGNNNSNSNSNSNNNNNNVIEKKLDFEHMNVILYKSLSNVNTTFSKKMRSKYGNFLSFNPWTQAIKYRGNESDVLISKVKADMLIEYYRCCNVNSNSESHTQDRQGQGQRQGGAARLSQHHQQQQPRQQHGQRQAARQGDPGFQGYQGYQQHGQKVGHGGGGVQRAAPMYDSGRNNRYLRQQEQREGQRDDYQRMQRYRGNNNYMD